MKLQKIVEAQESIESLPFKKGDHYITERHIHYREYLPGVWFPENIEQTTHQKGDLIGKTTLQAVSFEVNVDVSNQFQLELNHMGIIEGVR